MTEHRTPVSLFFDRIVLRYPRMVIVSVLVVVALLSVQARHFRLDASADTLVLEDDRDLKYSRLIDQRYGQHDFLVVAYSPDADLLSRQTLATLAGLRDDLEKLERVCSVVSILDVPLLQSPPVKLKQLTGELPTLASPGVRLDLARAELSQSPIYQNLLVSPDLRTTALLINFAPDRTYHELLQQRDRLRQRQAQGQLSAAEADELQRVLARLELHKDTVKKQRHRDILAIRRILQSYSDRGRLFLGGVDMIADDMIGFIKSDLKLFGLGVLAFIVVTLGAVFRRARWVVVAMLCCGVAAAAMVGLLGWLGWKVTVISCNFISLQLIITIAIVIHLVVRYRELLLSNPDRPNRRLILETIELKIKPCVYAVATTIVGFGSLVLCDILPVITFGWMMIVGLVVSLLVSFLLFPAVLVLLPKEKPPSRAALPLSPTSALARFTENHGLAVIFAGAIVLIASVAGATRLKVENCFIDYFGKDTEIYQGMKLIDQQLGGTTPLDVVIDFPAAANEPAAAESPAPVDDVFDEFAEFDQPPANEKYWFTPEKMALVKKVHSYLDSLPATGKVLSLASMLSVAEQLNGGRPLDSFELALLYSETPQKFRDMLIRPYVSVEHNQVRFWVRVRDSDRRLRRNELLKKIKRDICTLPELDCDRVHLAGLLVLYNNMLQSLFGSQILTLGATVLVLAGMFLLLFRSATIALIAMVVNVLPVAAVLGVMGWLGIPLDMMTITIAAIGVGIAVDDAIHYIHRFKREFAAEPHYVRAMYRCHGSIGHAMYYTSVVITVGFSVLALSNFVPSVRFGLLTGLAMLIAMLADLTLLPRLLILLKPFGKEA